MNNKLVKAALAGAACVALAAAGTTWSAFTDSGTIADNSVGAGFLRLNLNGQDGSSAATPISFGRLAPGMAANRMIWLASNDGQSVPQAHISAQFSHLNDQENNCSSNSERAADPNDCNSNGQNSGELSRIVNVQTSYYPELTTQDECATYPGQGGYNAFFPSAQGDLFAAASGNGHTYTLNEPNSTNTPLTLDPGEGVCIGLSTYWPHDPSNQVSAPYNNDDVAQGDSFTFDVKFILNQV